MSDKNKIPVLGPVIKPKVMLVRPSSALGNIQTHKSYTTGLYDKKCNVNREQKLIENEERESLKMKKAITHIGFDKMSVQVTEPDREVDVQRRRTIEIVDGIDIKKFLGREMSLALAKRNILEKIEERINLNVLEELKNAFQRDKNETRKLDLEEFKDVLCEKLQLHHAEERHTENLFKKIDWASTQAISWDDFCTYMQLEYAEKDEAYLKAREMAFNLPAKLKNTPHRENVFRITSTTDGTFIAGSKDGILSFWNSNLELKKCKTVLTPDQSQRQKSKWIIDFLIMTEFNKIIVATGDREIQFFELSSFEPYCRIHSLETVPLCLDYYVDRENNDDCLLLWGDRQGCVNILHMHATGECLRTWKKQPRSEGIASIGMESVLANPTTNFCRWQAHNDWVLKVKYYYSLRQIISCSNDAYRAVVIGCLYGSTQVDQQIKSKQTNTATETTVSLASMMQAKKRMSTDQTVFGIYKGIQTFDFGKSKNVLVTGGLDRIIRLWNPYVNSKPTGMLRGHNKPIVYLHVAEAENRIFSICADKSIKVWDLHDHNCLLTVRPKSHSIRGDLQACHYSETVKSLMLATDQMAMLNIKVNYQVMEMKSHQKHKESVYVGGNYFNKLTKESLKKMKTPVLHTDVALSHKEPVNCCRYNDQFNTVITCCEGGVVKLWNLDNGEKIFEFDDTHDDGGITCVTFDNSGRRLLTGGRDGAVRMWNFNNGHCLTEFVKDDSIVQSHYSEEIHDVKYIEISRNKFILAVGWDKAINVYIDQCDSEMHRAYYPTPRWPDDVQYGHTEDILSMATLKGHLLATADYGGTIIIWNLMSGHMFFKIVAPPAEVDSDYLTEDLSINKLLFLQSRYGNQNSASLVASGPYGLIHFWNVKKGESLYARFKGGLESGQSITSMTTYEHDDKEDHFLLVGDRFGFISLWNIVDYATEHPEDECPELVNRWRAHTGSVECMDVVTSAQVVISCSDDRTVRLWTLEEGEYVGTFGQIDTWDLSNPNTFQHPLMPFDVLVHPRSMPDHPILGPRMTVEERKQRNRDEASQRRAARSAKQEDDGDTLNYSSSKIPQYIDDATINEMVNKKPYQYCSGKRLKYERLRSKTMLRDDGGPNEYRSLEVFNMETPPLIMKPKIESGEKNEVS